MATPLARIAYITAGTAGSYCGSCLRDNTLAVALGRLGVDVQLIPLYAPIRTDRENVQIDRVFFGGLNVYLQQAMPLFRLTPPFLDRMFNHPTLLRWIGSRGVRTGSKLIGATTVSMLHGRDGRQRKEVDKLVAYLAADARPQLVNLSNMLIAGCAAAIREALDVPIVVTLQGDDLFLDRLAEPYRSQAMARIRRLAAGIDGFIAFSRDYAEQMSGYFDIPPERIHVVPLGIDVRGFPTGDSPLEASAGSRGADTERPPTIGYLARLAPEKGLHVLVEALVHLRRMPGTQTARLHVAGGLDPQNRNYFQEQREKLRRAGLADAFFYAGEVDHGAKIAFLNGLDVLTVPATRREAKGLFVLESLAAGVPVVQPDHGVFREILSATGGGRLVRPGDPEHLAEALADLLADPAKRRELGQAGRRAVHRSFTAETMARATLDVYRRIAERKPA